MQVTPLVSRPLLAAALLALAGGAHGAITVFTTQAAFTAAVIAAATDSFAGLAIGANVASPLNRTAGAYAYRASATDGFYPVAPLGDPALSTETATDTITFSNFSASVSAIGGVFFNTTVDGLFQQTQVTLVATDTQGTTSSQTFTAGPSTFFGFLSTARMTSLVVTASDSLWPTVDSLTLATSVPEPDRAGLLVSGLLLLGFFAARLQRRD